MPLKEKLHNPWRYIITTAKWFALGILVGIVGGLIGAAFHHTLAFANTLRKANSWLIWLMPIGGLAIVGLYKLLRLTHNRGTNEVIDSVLHREEVNPLITPAIFISTALTQLVGGSAGREGATLQMGASVSSLIAKLLHFKKTDRTMLVMSGMSAVFAGLFGTPLTACLFTMEFESVGTIFSPALLPCFISAFTASRISLALGVHPETFALGAFDFTLGSLWRILILALALAALGIIMCKAFHSTEHFAHRLIPKAWLRVIVGAAVIMLLTLAVGDQRFNGAGMDLAMSALHGSTDWYTFALKIIFTAITIAAGFRGGEIVPTFAVGASFGCFLGSVLGLDPGYAAALGLVGLFCCTTNSPLASIILSIEMFGGHNIHMFALVCVVCFIISGKSGLYSSQIIQFSLVDQDPET
ncbi:MAG: chloride channel protein [Oscillospiraceae bacterium]|nr:chloride channel protein [Oscillospiraceae bacterium]